MTEANTIQRPERGGLRLQFLSTTATSLISVAAAGLTGIYIARVLGTTARGEYASIMAWFGVTLAIGEIGQTAATTYYISKNRADARGYVATSRMIMAISGVLTLLVGIGLAPLLSHQSTSSASGFRLMFATCIFSYIGASLIFSLQAVATFKWNLIRVFQPLAYAVAVWLLHLTAHLTLIGCLVATSTTILMQTILAYVICRASGLAGGKASRRLSKPLLRYGGSQLAASIPALVVARTDILFLSLTVSPAEVGLYAVAASLTALAAPAVSAIGSVAFPRIAARHTDDPAGTRRLARQALAAAAGVAGLIAVTLALISQWLTVTVFGPGYAGAARLMWVLAPAGAVVACAQVCSDLLRGYGRPFDVARAQWIAAGVTAVATLLVVPHFGAMGAAFVTATSGTVSFALLFRRLSVIS